jgi:hypothetical protein
VIKVGDYVRYKDGFRADRGGTVVELRKMSTRSDSGKQARVLWCDASKPLKPVWEWCDHLKVLATSETK